MTLFAQRKRTNLEIISKVAVRHQHTNLAIPSIMQVKNTKAIPSCWTKRPQCCSTPSQRHCSFPWQRTWHRVRRVVCLPGDSDHNISYRVPCSPVSWTRAPWTVIELHRKHGAGWQWCWREQKISGLGHSLLLSVLSYFIVENINILWM